MAGPAKPRTFIWNFCFGLVFGGCFTYTLVRFSTVNRYFHTLSVERDRSLSANSDVYKLGGHIVVDESNRVLESELKKFEQHHHHDFFGQDSLAKILYDKVRVLCWVMTGPQNIDKKAVHIYATWGKRCNKIVFISSEDSDKVPVVQVGTKEGREFLWQKTRAAFQYIYDNLVDDYEWFLKADDDTFVIVENLRYFLSSYDPETPIYFGHKFKPYVKQGYMSGGGGYVTSRKGVKQLVDNTFGDEKKCKKAQHVGGAEDVEIGKCMENAGVTAGDSRDDRERNRFHPFQPEAHLNPSGLPEKFWYWSYIYYPRNEGFEGCCSDYSVTFHYIPPAALYNLEYLVYHLRPFNIGSHPCPVDLPKEILREAFSQQLLQSQSKQDERISDPHEQQQQQQQQELEIKQEKEDEPQNLNEEDQGKAQSEVALDSQSNAVQKGEDRADNANNSVKVDPPHQADGAGPPGETVR